MATKAARRRSWTEQYLKATSLGTRMSGHHHPPIRAADLAREVRGYLLDVFERKVVDARGQVRNDLYTRNGRRRALPQYGGFIGPAAAYLALTPFDGNPYHGSEALLRLALEAGDQLVLDHSSITRDTKPNHFTIYPLATLYEMVADRAGAARRRAWCDTMARNLEATDALIDRAWRNLGRPGPYAGTGPNHFFGWLSVGYQQATLLGDDALAGRIARAMQRHLRLQAPGGYFPEHIGPAVGYHHVSLGGVAEYHRLNPSAATRRAVQRGVDFMIQAMYPDLRGIETFDERNRLGRGPGFHPALAWTAEGRHVLAHSVAQSRRYMQGEPIDGPALCGYEWWILGGAFRCHQHALATQDVPVARQIPQDRARYTWRLEDAGLVRKQGPWFYALSAWAHGVEPGNPYHFDRTQAMSLYHDAAGLIVGGGNDKRAYHAATIHIVEGGEVHYFPPETGRLRVGAAPRVLNGGGTCDRVEFDYGAAQAMLEMRAESDRRLRIGLAVQLQMTQPDVALVLQLPIEPPAVLRGGSTNVKLPPARDGQGPKTHPLGRTLELPGGAHFTLPSGATLIWPHLPWNPYKPPLYRVDPEGAVALLRVPLSAPQWKAEVVVEVAAQGPRPHVDTAAALHRRANKRPAQPTKTRR